MAAPIRVLLADDQPLIRDGLRATLATTSEIEIVGEAEDGIQATRFARILRPEIVLMDICMPRMNGVEATRVLCQDPQLPSLRVLILSVYDQEEYIFDSLRAGASGFLVKTVPTEKIREAVRTIAAGDALLAPSVTRTLITEFVRRPVTSTVAAPELVQFTDRELDVFKLLVCGYHNDEIAQMLMVGESTVKSHVQHLYRKLGVRDRVQVIIYAYEHGLLQPGVGFVFPDRVT